ncbi:MAG TPA: hypothetical protein VEX64_11970 [Pyrinomonadaceae bacterium]|jgi:hypothetical protein|nr:hypothetical protein [Pyrinomonadaceae bacterium]
MSENLTTLYRPVGQKELDLISESGFTKFPPRLPEQPIFYPVCNQKYAEQIAKDWNAKHNADKVGFVTRFQVKTEFLGNYEIQTVGGELYQEYWIPAEELAEFNENIIGKIEVVSEFRNDK